MSDLGEERDMNHLLNVLDGFVSMLNWGPHTHRRAYVISRGGFARDQNALRQDAINVGNDLRTAIKVYGQQGTSRTSYQQKR